MSGPTHNALPQLGHKTCCTSFDFFSVIDTTTASLISDFSSPSTSMEEKVMLTGPGDKIDCQLVHIDVHHLSDHVVN